tara:strand:+ start:222 stop:554 length:333 start_codon:yes stop_codon:yes gene_type:complete
MVPQRNDRRKQSTRILSIIARSLNNPPTDNIDFLISKRVRIDGHTLLLVIRRHTMKELGLEVPGLEVLAELLIGIQPILSFCFSLLMTSHTLPLQNRSHLAGKTHNFCGG